MTAFLNEINIILTSFSAGSCQLKEILLYRKLEAIAEMLFFSILALPIEFQALAFAGALAATDAP